MPGLGTTPDPFDRGPLAIRGDGQMLSGSRVLTVSGAGGSTEIDVRDNGVSQGTTFSILDFIDGTGNTVDVTQVSPTEASIQVNVTAVPTSTWAEVLAAGNVSGGTSPTISSGDALVFGASDATISFAANSLSITSSGSSGAQLVAAAGNLTLQSTTSDVNLNSGDDITLSATDQVNLVGAGATISTTGNALVDTDGSDGLIISGADGGQVTFIERSFIPSPNPGEGKLWVQNLSANRLMFSDDAAVNNTLAYVSELGVQISEEAAPIGGGARYRALDFFGDDGLNVDCVDGGSFAQVRFGVDDGGITLPKIQNIQPARVLGRQVDAGSAGPPLELTGAEVGEISRHQVVVQRNDGSGAIGTITLDETVSHLTILTAANSDVPIYSQFTFDDDEDGHNWLFHLQDNFGGVGPGFLQVNAGGTQANIRVPGDESLKLTHAGEGVYLGHPVGDTPWRIQGALFYPFFNSIACVADDIIRHNGRNYQREKLTDLANRKPSNEFIEYFWEEDFSSFVVLAPAAQDTALIGDTTWTLNQDANVSTYFFSSSPSVGHVGNLRIVTAGTAANDFTRIFKGTTINSGVISASVFFETRMIWSLIGSVANSRVNFGVTEVVDRVVQSSNAQATFLVNGTSNTQFVTSNGTSFTTTNITSGFNGSGVPVQGVFYHTRIYQDTNGDYVLENDGVELARHVNGAANIPASEFLNFGLVCWADTAASRIFDIDYISGRGQQITTRV